MVSGTITDQSGRTLSGQTAEAFYVSVMHSGMLRFVYHLKKVWVSTVLLEQSKWNPLLVN